MQTKLAHSSVPVVHAILGNNEPIKYTDVMHDDSAFCASLIAETSFQNLKAEIR